MINKNVIFSDSSVERLFKSRISADNRYKFKIYALKYLPILLVFALMGGLKGIIFGFIWWVLITMFCDHRVISEFRPVINVWFGVPGSGKTSVAAWLTKKSLAAGYNVLSNVPIKGALKLEEEDLGKYDMSFDGCGAHVIYDEATINGLDNRQHKAFASSDKPKYFSLHRHMQNRVDVFSQGYDIDKRIRDRAGSSGLFYLKRFPIPGFCFYRMIKKVMFIKKDDKQMIDGFQFRGLPRIVYTRPVWDSFDTLDMSLCPKEQKNWKEWNFEE